MAIGKKSGGRDFEPGQSGNPNGRPKLPGDIKEARKLNAIEFERIANKFLFLSREEIKAIVNDPDTTMIENLIASIYVRGVTEGSYQHLDFILNRLIGKVKDKVEVESKPFIVRLLDGSEIHMGHKPEEKETDANHS